MFSFVFFILCPYHSRFLEKVYPGQTLILAPGELLMGDPGFPRGAHLELLALALLMPARRIPTSRPREILIVASPDVAALAEVLARVS